MDFIKWIYNKPPTQILALFLCFGIGLWASRLSSSTIDMSISEMFYELFSSIDQSNSELDLFSNFFLPAILFIVSCGLSLSLAIFNFFTLSGESNLDKTLKIVLGLFQLTVFGYFFINGGMLLWNVIIFSVIVMVVGIMLISAISQDNKRGYR